MADNWLGVPKLLTPEEIVNPNVDELSMMTYLSNFPNSKVIFDYSFVFLIFKNYYMKFSFSE